MAISLKEWEQEAAKLTKKERAGIAMAIKTLKKWKTFDDNYKWTGYETIGAICDLVDEKEFRRQRDMATTGLTTVY